jgi:hypothetical protein
MLELDWQQWQSNFFAAKFSLKNGGSGAEGVAVPVNLDPI